MSQIPTPPVSWQSFHVGPLTIHYYALIMLLAIVVAAIWTGRRLTARGAEPGIILDIVIAAVPAGIVVARFYHVFTHPDEYFYSGANPWAVLYIWDGGNAIFGAILGGAAGVLIYCRVTGLRFWSFADAFVPGMLLAQAVGRMGNYMNSELFGLPTNLPWGLAIPSTNVAYPVGLPSGTLFQPLFLYEIIWDLLGVLVLLMIERHWRPRWGILFGMYLIWYGAGRSYLESIRIDPSEQLILGIPTNVWAAFLAVFTGVVIVWVQGVRHKGAEPSVYRPGKEWADPAAAIELYDLDELLAPASGS